MARSGFAPALVAEFDAAKILGVLSGTTHRYAGVWVVVVVEGRVFARSLGDAPTGWLRAFRAEPGGGVQVGKRVPAVRGTPVRSARLREAVSTAYAAKYPTSASQKRVTGFAEPERAANTLEFVPA